MASWKANNMMKTSVSFEQITCIHLLLHVQHGLISFFMNTLQTCGLLNILSTVNCQISAQQFMGYQTCGCLKSEERVFTVNAWGWLTKLYGRIYSLCGLDTTFSISTFCYHDYYQWVWFKNHISRVEVM